MISLYVTSLSEGVGRTAVCAGVGKHLLDNGKKVGFLKPIIADSKNPPEVTDSDAVFMKHVFALEEPIDRLCPVVSDQNNLASRIKEACAEVSPGKDVVIVEGMCKQTPEGRLSETFYRVVEALDARVIIVQGYSEDLPKTINTSKDFGEYLLGVVLNKVPRSQLEGMYSEVSTQFGKAGINILGVLPEDRVLFTLTVGELAERIQGKILNCAEKSAELVENFMLGAMCVDPGPEYFGRKVNKAAIVRGERPDMQLAALETSTKCLVVSGNVEPITTVIYLAEEKGVPIIVTSVDTIAAVKSIEEGLGRSRFNQEKKLPRLAEIMEEHFNFEAVYRGLGLAS